MFAITAGQLFQKRLENRPKPRVCSANLKIVGSNSQDSHPSLLLHSGNHSYLFNCPSGWLRKSTEYHQVKSIEIENVFLTRLDWSHIDGIYGLALTNHDSGALQMVLHGPNGVEGFFNPTTRFVTLKTKMELKSSTEPIFKNDDIRVEAISIGPKNQTKKIKTQLPKVVAYSCSIPEPPPQIVPDRCRQLNVPFGPLIGKLKAGQDVTLPDGRLIKSKDVTGPPMFPGANLLIIDCPTQNYIEYLSTCLEDVQHSMRQADKPNFVVHLGNESVCNDEKYKSWMDEFGDSCKHIFVANEKTNMIGLPNSFHYQYLLNRLDPVLFPLLDVGKDLEHLLDQERNALSHSSETSENCLYLRNYDCLKIQPRLELEVGQGPDEVGAKHREIDASKFNKEFQALHEAQASFKSNLYEPEIVFLGTSSARPGKYRNVSCILVNFTEPYEYSVILDCGEDSLGQMIRFFGAEGADNVLKNLKFIYISHQHADHQLGLISLLRRRRALTAERLAILIPPEIEDILKHHNGSFDDISDSYEIFFTNQMRDEHSAGASSSKLLKKKLYQKLGGILDEVVLVNVTHSPNACAVKMSFKLGHSKMDNFSLAYSGDTRPMENFVRIGKNCDLLIHEATFDHLEVDHAIFKRHSTSTEAINIGKRMNAKFTILTHFSAKMSKVPCFTEEFDDKVGFAFDNMRIRYPSEVGRIPLMKPILTKMFEEDWNEISEKRLRKKTLDQLRKDALRNESLEA